MDNKRKNELINIYREGLLEDILPFWFPNVIDEKFGGYMIIRDRDGSILDTDKGMWTQCRFAWLLATVYNTVEKRDEWLKGALHGIDFIAKHGFDDDGRMWFHVTREGKPIRKRRYVFTEFFAAKAFAACARASGDEKLVQRANETYQLAKTYLLNPDLGPKKFTDTRPTRGLAVPLIRLGVAQEMRLNLEDDSYTTEVDEAINEIRDYFVKPELNCVMETVGDNGEILDHFDGRTVNPGHAIEGAWFILLEARLRGDDPDLVQLGCNMLDWMWKRGWDEECGGIYYFRDLEGKPVQEYWHDMKQWWVQNETVLGTLLAYLITKESRYAEMHRQIHDWVYAHFPDKKYGEWYGYLHRDGRVSVPLKGNMWKGPYHLPRMLLNGWKWLEADLES